MKQQPYLARAALYLRVSKGRQAEHDISIPDQRRQCDVYCRARQYEVVEVYAEQGVSATHDRRPEFRRMIGEATRPPRPFDLIVVHSFSRFFRDLFEFEFNVRKLGKNGVKLVSVTQEIGEDPMHSLMRRVIALFDEYQSKEIGKHVIRALKENARQGFWCGSTPPIGYRVVAAGWRGRTPKRKLDIDPKYADLIRLVYRLALHGNGNCGPMPAKKIASYLNERGLTTPFGGRWDGGQLRRILMRRTYIGEHAYNQRNRTSGRNPRNEIVIVPVRPIIERDDFEAVQLLLEERCSEMKPHNAYGPAPFLNGILFCSRCGGALTVVPGKGRRDRYYGCSIGTQPGSASCEGIAMPTAELDGIVRRFVDRRLLEPQNIMKLLQKTVDRRRKQREQLFRQTMTLSAAADDTEPRPKRLDAAIEADRVHTDESPFAEPIDTLHDPREKHRRAIDDIARMQERVEEMMLDPQSLKQAAIKTRRKIGSDSAAFKKFLQTIVERVDVAADDVRIVGIKSRLLAAIFHFGEGVVIARMDREDSKNLKAVDRFRCAIPRR